MAEWTREFMNDLPDAAFAVILPGGRKDPEGKTVPRDLRKLPHHTPEVRTGSEHDTVDLPHLRNALSRLPQTLLPAAEREKASEHLERHAKALGIGDWKEEAADTEAPAAATPVAEQTPVAARSPGEANECELIERVQAAPGRIADGIIHDVVILRSESANGRRYPAATLRRSIALFEGARVFANHAPGTRDVRDLVGVLRSVRTDGRALRADLEVFEELAGWLIEVARRAPEALGLSINALGRLGRQDGGDVVEEISQVRSVDVVAEPAAVGGLFEAKREDSYRIGSLEEEKRTLSAELERLKKENELLSAEKLQAERRRQVHQSLKKAGLPAELAGEEFVEMLCQSDEATAARLIGERSALSKSLSARPASALKPLFRRGEPQAEGEYLRAIKSL